MKKCKIIKIQQCQELIEPASQWFSEKWSVPKSAYLASMEDCLRGNSAVPQWYLCLDGDRIIAGLGVIENDFHNRKDLAPNICAVYVEKEYRKRGIAGQMLQFACDDFAKMNINTLYLITEHTAFYERYGWEFLCMVQWDDNPEMARMYIHIQ